MLAGHTHGGQIRLPGIGAVVNASAAPLRWTYGWVNEGGRRMYVTSGLGTSGLPIRLGIPPEYVRFDF
jgi:predicted MPP superfamily phosphohydrolase